MNKDNKEVETIKETPQQSDQKVEKTNETQLKEKKEDPTKYGDWQVKGRAIDF